MNDANENGKRERAADPAGESPPTKRQNSDEVPNNHSDEAAIEQQPPPPPVPEDDAAKPEPGTESDPQEPSNEARDSEPTGDHDVSEKGDDSKEAPSVEEPFVLDRKGVVETPNANPQSATSEPTHNPGPAAGVDPTAQATVVNPDQIVEERGEIPALYVGKVIGKGGEMIRDLQARSGARIDVDQNVPPGMPRGITYRGTRRTVDFAKYLVTMLQQEGVSENDLPLGEAKRRYVIIPAQTVGKVIGRGGEMIRELQNRSQAKIQIDHAGVSGMTVEQKQVSITGTEQAVVKAEEMIKFLAANPLMEGLQAINMLVEEKLRGGQWGSGPPYPGLPNHGLNMQPEGSGQHFTNYPPSAAAPVGVVPGVVGDYQMPHAHMGTPPIVGYGSNVPVSSLPSYGGGQEVDVVYAQKQFMGRIIGKKGITINDLQRRSSCDIQVNQDVPVGQDCEITIRGTRQGIEQAKQMIREIIDVGPQHPYAGGADMYGISGYQQQQQGYAPQYSGMAQPTFAQPYAYQGHTPGGYGQGPYQPAYQQTSYAVAPTEGYGIPTQQTYAQQQTQFGMYRQAPPAPAMPVTEWKAATSPDGQVYYYNERTGATQWEKPAGMS